MPNDVPTLKDVAERAGVSLATASRALSGDHPMTVDTRERVLAAVEATGYRRVRGRNRAATPMVAVVAAGLGHLVTAEVVAGIEDVSAEADRRCTIALTKAQVAREIAVLRDLADDDRVSAAIVVGGVFADDDWRKAITEVAATFAEREAPLVFCGREVRDLTAPGLRMLDYDNRGGAAAIVGMLLGQGHRAIGTLRGGPGFSTSDQRQAGYRQAFDDFGVPRDPDLEQIGDRHEQFGTDGMIALLRRRPDVTAVFAENDALATGAIRGARLLGLTLPDDVSIVGFDDMHGVANLAPALTTVHMPYAELGRRAARVALGLDTSVAGEPVVVGTHIVVRESVAPPRRGDLVLPD